MGKRSFISNILGGNFLVSNGGIIKQWGIILYSSFLIILYISLLFEVKDNKLEQVQNDKTIKNLKSEYVGKYSRLLYLTKKSETEKLLKKTNSKLCEPTVPPTIIKLEDNARE